MIYLNDIDKGAQAWLAQLYPGASIDGRSIADVKPDDIVGFRRVHFFAGIGGWEYALHIAGVPADMPVWTGSCPCQPFSVAGKCKGEADERHIWPEMRRIISECMPSVVFGEQVASRAGRQWLARVRVDLEALGYVVGSADLCAAGEGAPHIRQRLYWGAVRLPVPDRERCDGLDPLLRPWQPGETDPETAGSGIISGLLNTDRFGRDIRRTPSGHEARANAGIDAVSRMAVGPDTTSSPSPTGRRGALNPALSRWLMGFPVEWDIAAILAFRSMPKQRRKRGK